MKAVELSRTQCNRIYNNMFQRCYNERVHTIKPWYVGTTMCDEWYGDKEAVYDWINDGNFYEIEGEPTVELDHNILVKGNTIYSPDTCVFAPKSINSMIGGSAGNPDRELPKGVVQLKSGKYKPQIKGFHDVFNTPEEAWMVYAEHKKAQIIAKADEYAGKIPNKLYEALLNWKIEITD